MAGAKGGLDDIGDRLLFSRLEQPCADSRTEIAVVGDPHVATQSRGTHRVLHRTEQRLRTVIDDVNDRAVDLVVFPGDLTKDGEPWNYDRIDELLTSLDRPFVATPGNHDLQKRSDDHECPSAAAFAEQYATDGLPAHHNIGDLDLFVLNSASGPDGPYVDTHRGLIAEEQLAWLDDQLDGATTPIVVCHHNPFPIVNWPLCDTDPWKTFTLRDPGRFRSILAAHGVSLVVSGHHHLPSIVEQNELRQLIAPAIASYPQAYCLLEIDETGTNIWLVSHATKSGRNEAYELAANGPTFQRALLGITEGTLTDLPLLYEPSRVQETPVTN